MRLRVIATDYDTIVRDGVLSESVREVISIARKLVDVFASKALSVIGATTLRIKHTIESIEGPISLMLQGCAEEVIDSTDASATEVCQALSLSRSSFYGFPEAGQQAVGR